MRTDPRMLLRGLVKFVAVVVVAGLAGAGIGIALAELSGNDGASEPLLPATSERPATSAERTATASSTATSTTAAKAVYRVPRVQIVSAQLGPVSESTGRALVAVRVRVTNRGNRALTIKTPALLSGEDEVPLGSSARDAAGALLRPIDPGATAAGVLRFTVPSEIAQRLTANPGARLRIQNRVVVLEARDAGADRMITRYTRPDMGALWTDEARMEAWRRVEVAACEAMDGPSESELEAIRAATFTVEAVNERERTTDHDLAAFVDILSASAGDAGRWIHFGLTSSDVLDTATGVQLRAAGEIILAGARELVEALSERAREHVDTVCVGRTHGVHAEPTTFGIKLAGFAMEASRNVERLERAFAQVAVGAISGAVGTYAATSPEFEERVLAGLGLQREPVSTQVVARDRHAELLQTIALAGAGLERLATEIRHLQRTEVREVEEPFRAGQKGSSAMPHKRNPITTERITGLARVLRGNASAAVENVALWHERDISHSGAERVILPDSTILLDYLQHLAIRVVGGMVIHEDRMRENLDLTYGALFSQRVLLALVTSGMTRDDAYRVAQELAQRAWDERIHLRELLEQRPDLGLDLDTIFDLGHYARYAAQIVGRLPR